MSAAHTYILTCDDDGCAVTFAPAAAPPRLLHEVRERAAAEGWTSRHAGFGSAVKFLSVEPLLERLGPLDLNSIDWVIVGGESGPRAREMDADWVREIRDQCVHAGVKFFFKQWGGTRKHLTGRNLDGRTWDEYPAQ